MKKLTAALAALCLSVSLFGCGGKGGDHSSISDSPSESPEESVTLYLLSCATDYFADGSQGFSKTTYTYTEAGLPLTVQEDRGEVEALWDEELEVYIYRQTAYDGTVDASQTYTYDQSGQLTAQTFLPTEEQEDDAGWSYTYQYNADGRIEGCTAQSDTGTAHMYYRYNEAGRLQTVEYSEDGGETQSTKAAFLYDEAGRLIQSRGYGEDSTWEYCYRYGENGELTLMTYSFSESAGLDAITLHRTTEFSYDEDGRLISRKQYDGNGDPIASVLCDYNATGKLISVCYFQVDGNLDDPFTFEYDASGQTICVWTHKDDTTTELIYDENGNLIRRTNPDGSYTEYEYQTIQVTQAQADKARQAAYLLGGADADGELSPLLSYRADSVYCILLPLPQVSLHQTDLLRN